MKILNTNPVYGMEGPFKAESFDALADKMTSRFIEWAEDNWNKELELDEPDISKEDYIKNDIALMRADFIKGLEEVV
jgi:hypothetical protein